MTDEELNQRLDERLKCEAGHASLMVPHNGFGWTGTRCSKCGFMFFGEWEPQFIPSPDLKVQQHPTVSSETTLAEKD